jgi:EmrB/QacA subfamily drug resistance transporter
MAKLSHTDELSAPSLQVKGLSAVALLVAGAFFMEYIDGTVIATALPEMGRAFGVSAIDLNVGISAYLLTLAVFLPASGWVADRFGARKVFTSALALFTLASVLCGMTGSVASFVLMRIIQGIGGAMMVPVGRLAVLRTTPKNQLIKAIATLTWPALVAPIIGPPLGGFITSYANWRWIFYINLPLGIAAMLCAWKLLKDQTTTSAKPFDLLGFVYSGLALFCLTYSMELMGRSQPNLLAVIATLLISVVMLVLTVRHFQRAASPLLRLNALRVQTFAVTLWGGSLFRTSIGAVPFLLPLLFQVGFGMDAFHSGLLVLAVFAGNLAMKPATTPLIRALGFKPLLLINGVLSALALLACAFFTPQTPHWLILLVLFWGGLCRSMQFTGLSTLAFADIAQPQMSDANTLFSTSLQLSMGMGVAIGAIGVRLGETLGHSSYLASMPGISFRLAFVLLALMSGVGLIDLLRLPAQAGSNVSNKK